MIIISTIQHNKKYKTQILNLRFIKQRWTTRQTLAATICHWLQVNANYFNHSEAKSLEYIWFATFSVSSCKFFFYFSNNLLLKFWLILIENFFLDLNEFIVLYWESSWYKMFWWIFFYSNINSCSLGDLFFSHFLCNFSWIFFYKSYTNLFIINIANITFTTSKTTSKDYNYLILSE